MQPIKKIWKGVVAMIEKKLLDRINELARKKKDNGLTHQEKVEQAKLRKVYLQGIRTQVKAQLSNVRFIDKKQ